MDQQVNRVVGQTSQSINNQPAVLTMTQASTMCRGKQTNKHFHCGGPNKANTHSNQPEMAFNDQQSETIRLLICEARKGLVSNPCWQNNKHFLYFCDEQLQLLFLLNCEPKIKFNLSNLGPLTEVDLLPCQNLFCTGLTGFYRVFCEDSAPSSSPTQKKPFGVFFRTWWCLQFATSSWIFAQGIFSLLGYGIP